MTPAPAIQRTRRVSVLRLCCPGDVHSPLVHFQRAVDKSKSNTREAIEEGVWKGDNEGWSMESGQGGRLSLVMARYKPLTAEENEK